MLPTQAQSLYFGGYVPLYDPSFQGAQTALSFASPAAFFSAEIVPYVPFGTDFRRPGVTPAAAVGGAHAKGNAFPVVAAHAGTRTAPPQDAASDRAPSTRAGEESEDAEDETPTRCPFYMRTGTCAYGSRCRFYHPPNQKPPPLNYEGYPLRKGVQSCPYYMKNGICGFGATCKFHHPPLPKNRVRPLVERVATPHMVQYGPWPRTGWYTPRVVQPVLGPLVQNVYPAYPCMPPMGANFKETLVASPILTPSRAGSSCLSSGANNETKEEAARDDSSSEGYCSDDGPHCGCWSY